ncbi:MAG: N-acetyltransferase [Chloroflexi bacterium]|nr:MAG: N-acetyltransferase [Chloroflexota bacterium]
MSAYHFVQATTLAALEQFCAFPGAYPVTPQSPAMEDADAHWLALAANETPVARCSLWWRNTPPPPAGMTDEQGTLGLIGHYAATDTAAGVALLEHTCRELATRNCTLAVGPLDGNTFRHYRLLTERTIEGPEHLPFFLEPDNPDDWPVHFTASGFAPLAHYFSALAELAPADPRTVALADQVAAHGVRVRNVEMAHFEAELQRIYQIVLQSFHENFLYLPISATEFFALYKPLRPLVEPELVLIAEHDDSPAGFLFALPDLAQAQRGERIDTVIIKTVGVVPALAGIGLGGLLVALAQERAFALGYRSAIHALMYEDNRSRKISARYARPMRRYTLFARPLSG